MLDAEATVKSSSVESLPGFGTRYCLVAGEVKGGFPEFEIHLPTDNWNGRFVSLAAADGPACASYVKDGYACMPMYRFGLKNPLESAESGSPVQALVRRIVGGRYDWNGSVHTLTQVAKSTISEFYEDAAEFSYLMGCSAGGNLALTTAQRFPRDFDGVMAGGAQTDFGDFLLRLLYHSKYIQKLTDADIQTLHDGALRACDGDDGLKDGVISNPMSCRFSPRELKCGGRGLAGKSCLGEPEIDFAERIYSSPRGRDGKPLAPGVGFLPGSELQWRFWGSKKMDRNLSAFSELAFPGAKPAFNYENVDFEREYGRIGIGATYVPSTPDLRPFRAAGGKLMMVQGADDVGALTGQMIDYFEVARAVAGGKVDNFLRFYLIPGANHCGASGAGAHSIDSLPYLRTWVEKGVGPDFLVATKPNSKGGSSTILPPESTKPVFSFPGYYKYRGEGDVNNVDSYDKIDPEFLRGSKF
ncbi:tannase/feruloyl esterase family alpha/beta hydrolase [Sphingopyxis chilensis]|uniref:tannase/feruloyl esterase family alpha/beta hydrolase n=1 Tax=Sphingopyxis chilensis TaxID=180400 RepID=UPI002DDCC7C2|nr:tannase/feruloyl esterase family alpha/beta hydrolase [Sphingopyxis chilensis]